MIDWHSHILPGIDDGSKNVDESILMLEHLSRQGITTVIATPHFYADNNSVEDFLELRAKSLKRLSERMNNDYPQILLGAEVCYYPGIAKLADLKKLCIEGTDILLLEMPLSKWTEYTVNEVIELSNSGDFTVVLAHIERYIKFQSKATLKKLHDNEILMQMNASFVNSFRTRKKAFGFIRNGVVRFLGSDCHNMTTRPPRIGGAYNFIRKKIGDDFVSQMNEYGFSMLKEINILF